MIRRILLTGSGGFLGSYLARTLREYGYEVLSPPSAELPLHELQTTYQWLSEQRFDAVVHAAGRTRGTPDELARDNITASKNLTKALLQVHAVPWPFFVGFGSASEYGEVPDGVFATEEMDLAPLHDYGRSKLEASTVVLNYPGSVLLMPSNVVGSPPLVGSLLDTLVSAEDGDEVVVNDLGVVRDFVSARDVAQAVVKVLKSQAAPGRYNVCSGTPTSLAELAECFARAGQRFDLKERPADQRNPETRWFVASHKKLSKATGWQKTDAIQDMIDELMRTRKCVSS